MQKVGKRVIIKEVTNIERNNLLDLKNDLVFQELFGNQKNSEITGHLLSLILEREVKNVDLDLNKRMLGDREDSKIGRLDIRARFNEGEDCDIELQVAPYKQVEKRLLDYWANMYILKINSGQNYSILRPSISILIANYKLPILENIPDYHTVWNLRERKYKNIILTRDIEVHILEIPKIKKKEIKKDELALWLKFIQNPINKEVRKNMESTKNVFLLQAEKELAYLSGDKDFKRLVQAREGFLRDQYEFELAGIKKGETIGREEGLKEGREEGREEGLKEGREEGLKEGLKEGRKEGREEGIKEAKKEMVKELLKLDIAIEKISEITGLSVEEIEKLKEGNAVKN